MVYLVDPELSFIDRTMHGPCHIAHKPIGRAHLWQTGCGRKWHRDGVSELTARELADNDPDTFVCRGCKRRAPDGAIRIEE